MNDRDLISQSALKEYLSYLEKTAMCNVISFEELRVVIDAAPAVDAVEVVRCKDCKWYKRGIVFKDEMFCFRPEANGVPVISLYKDDDFCSYGERKDGDGNG